MEQVGDTATDGRATEVSEESIFIQHYVELLEQEIPALLKVLEFVEETEWSAPPAAFREVQGRSVKNITDDPVGSTACDPLRLAIRDQSRRSELLLKDAVVKVRGVRRGLERSVRDWQNSHYA